MDETTTGIGANFFFNSMLAKALVQLLPKNEKVSIRLWLDKLLHTNKNEKELEIRDEYMWFILMMLQCQKIRVPFTQPPPAQLGPLRDLVAPKVYEEILVGNGDNMSLNKSALEKTVPPEFGPEHFRTSAPAHFLKNQPLPKEGIICYLSAFSDQKLS